MDILDRIEEWQLDNDSLDAWEIIEAAEIEIKNLRKQNRELIENQQRGQGETT